MPHPLVIKAVSAATCRHLLCCWNHLRDFSTSPRSLEGFAPEEAGQDLQKTCIFAQRVCSVSTIGPFLNAAYDIVSDALQYCHTYHDTLQSHLSSRKPCTAYWCVGVLTCSASPVACSPAERTKASEPQKHGVSMKQLMKKTSQSTSKTQ